VKQTFAITVFCQFVHNSVSLPRLTAWPQNGAIRQKQRINYSYHSSLGVGSDGVMVRVLELQPKTFIYSTPGRDSVN